MAADDPQICGGRRVSERDLGGGQEEDGGEIFVRVPVRRRLGAVLGRGSHRRAVRHASTKAPTSCPSSTP